MSRREDLHGDSPINPILIRLVMSLNRFLAQGFGRSRVSCSVIYGSWLVQIKHQLALIKVGEKGLTVYLPYDQKFIPYEQVSLESLEALVL